MSGSHLIWTCLTLDLKRSTCRIFLYIFSWGLYKFKWTELYLYFILLSTVSLHFTDKLFTFYSVYSTIWHLCCLDEFIQFAADNQTSLFFLKFSDYQSEKPSRVAALGGGLCSTEGRSSLDFYFLKEVK